MNPQEIPAPQPHAQPTAAVDYTSNPFLLNVKSLVSMLRENPVASLLCSLTGLLLFGIAYVVFLVLTAVFNDQAVIVGILTLILLVIGAVLITAYYGAQYLIGVASEHKVRLGTVEAYRKVMNKVPAMLAFNVIYTLLVLVGLFLLIIPGLILLARGSLGIVALLDENLGPIAALKRSFALTKKHVNEMLGALFASSFLVGGSYGLLTGPASVAPFIGRFYDLKRLEASTAPKPKTHWLNYLAFGLIVTLLAGFILLTVFVSIPEFQQESSEIRLQQDSNQRFEFESTTSPESIYTN